MAIPPQLPKVKENKMSIKRHDGVFLFDVINSNPNGDPDAGNAPRTFDDGRGFGTDICIKRKLRNFVSMTKEGKKGFDIAISKGNNFDEISAAHSIKELVDKYFDYRVFGVVLPKGAKVDGKKEAKKGDKHSPDHITGPLQFSLFTSIDPVNIVNIQITRMAASGQDQTMGNKKVVAYGLYKCVFNINPYYAEKTGMTKEDIDVVLEALVNCWDLEKSSVRADISPRALFVFEHKNPMGCHSRSLHNLIKIAKSVDEPTKPEDYTISVDEEGVPEGVELTVNQIF